MQRGKAAIGEASMHLPRVVNTIFLASIAHGCSGGFGSMDGIMQSWDGAPLDAAIAQWGYPNQEQNIAGHHLFTWYYNKSVINATTYGGGTLTGNCTRILEVNDKNIVIKWYWSGTNCPFGEAFEYSSWRRK
jgi:hypothetical protein